MGGTMSRIMPSIYVGGIASAKANSYLDENNVTHICSVMHYQFEATGRNQKLFLAGDSPTEDLSKYFEEACLFIHEARVSGGAALIHCACGVSRSVTITVAYVMTITGLSLKDSFQAVQGARHCACPNHGFVDQLLEFEKSNGPAKLKAKLIERFGEWPTEKLEEDLNELKKNIAIQDYYYKHGYYEGEEPVRKPKSSNNDDKSTPAVPSSFISYTLQKVPTLDEIIADSRSVAADDLNVTKQ